MEDKIKLFCIPYAGGSANIFKDWNSSFPSEIEISPIELAGRGTRSNEPFYKNLNEAVDDILDQIIEDIKEFNYALFGHSMGAFLAYELTQKIMALKLPMPKQIIFSGRQPPGISQKAKTYSIMSPAEFEDAILALGGTPPEFFKYPELKEMFIPLLRSDFSLSETVVERPEIIPLDTDITILLGEDEGISATVAAKWHAHTQKKCNIHFIKGGHFFLKDQKKLVVKLICSNLIPIGERQLFNELYH